MIFTINVANRLLSWMQNLYFSYLWLVYFYNLLPFDSSICHYVSLLRKLYQSNPIWLLQQQSSRRFVFKICTTFSMTVPGKWTYLWSIFHNRWCFSNIGWSISWKVTKLKAPWYAKPISFFIYIWHFVL